MKKLTHLQNNTHRSTISPVKRIGVLSILIALIISTITPAIARASDLQFYSGNDILTYDKDAIKCAVDSKTTGTGGISNITPEQKIAQTFIVGFAPSDTATMKTIVTKYKIGGLFPVGGASGEHAALTKAFFDELNTAAGAKLFIGSDDEGGDVARFTKGITPTAEDMGKLSAADAEAKGQEAGKILANNGLNGDLAPVLDIATPGTLWTQYHRDWSSNPDTITSNAGGFAKGLKASGITPVYKHFPGIGKVMENTDAAKSTPQSLASLADDLKPYAALANQNSAGVMLSNGFVSDWGDTPVSVNKQAVDYLHNTIKFTGTITTDALNALSTDYGSSKMDLSTAIVAALNAGVDMPLFIPTGDADAAIDAAIKAVAAGVTQPVIDAAYAKSLTLRGLQAPVAATPGTNTGSSAACCKTASTGGGSANLTGKDNIEKVLSFLMGKGLTLAQSAGVVGNFQIESFEDIKPNAQEIGKWPLGGFGIAQWTGGRRIGDKLNLVDYLTKANVMDLYVDGNAKLSDADNNRLLAAELDFFWAEEQDTEKASLTALQGITGNTAADAEQAAKTFERVHERCSPTNGEAGCDVPKRMSYASAAFTKYSDAAPLTGVTPAGATPSAAPAAGAGLGTDGSGPVIAIDPGHGGEIPNYNDTVSKLEDRETPNSPEREDVLGVANTVKTALEKAGYTVVLLRTTADQVINKRARVDAAVAAKASLTISIHTSPGALNDVWPQRVGTSRSYNGTTVSVTNDANAKLSQKYADAIAAARKTAEGHDISLDPDNSHQAGSFNRGDIPSPGNVSLVQLWGQNIPWVYNEIGQDGPPNSGITSPELLAKYADGLIKGIEAAVPSTGTPSGGNTGGCAAPAGNTSGATGNKIVDTALSLAWPNKGKHAGTDKSLARDTYQTAMPQYNLQTGNTEWTDCGVFTATVMHMSGADTAYVGRGTPDQLAYITTGAGKDKFTTIIPTDTSQLKPGMVAVLSGHTYIYTGPYKGDDGQDYDIAQASLGDHPPEAGKVFLSDSRGPYTFGALK